ncbi:hypothetical protein LX77_01355 [Gelidibacter algens]|uniref:Uncharacterized protein n=1 Tax=Gelidibacter algens TaxID=49280 RepID=A0A327SJL1_9FLAO|nr:hypothetical protein LX77_01355 [Gelidibacter algens]
MFAVMINIALNIKPIIRSLLTFLKSFFIDVLEIWFLWIGTTKNLGF